VEPIPMKAKTVSFIKKMNIFRNPKSFRYYELIEKSVFSVSELPILPCQNSIPDQAV